MKGAGARVDWDALAAENAAVVCTVREICPATDYGHGPVEAVIARVIVLTGTNAGTVHQEQRVLRAGIREPLTKRGLGADVPARVGWRPGKDGQRITLLNNPRAGDIKLAAIAVVKEECDEEDAAKAKGSAPGADHQRRLSLRKASEITAKATRWLWAEERTPHEFIKSAAGRQSSDWLPLGGLCLLAGREGIGKSTWGYRLVGQVTTGTLPGELYGVPRNAVVVATEDSWESTIVPRLQAAGADLDRVFRVDAIVDGLVTGLTLPTDIPALTSLCVDNEVALVLLDPLMGTIGGTLDSHKDHDVRVALEPLSRLAHNARVTILGLIHVNKSASSDLLSRIMASRAFSAVARAVLFCQAEAPSGEPDAISPEKFYLGQAKNNLGPKVTHSLAYHIQGIQTGHDEELNLPIWSSRIVVDGIEHEGIQSIADRQEQRGPVKESAGQRAEFWLRAFLGGRGEVPSPEVKDAATLAGHSERTVLRALGSMGGKITAIPGTRKETTWSLP